MHIASLKQFLESWSCKMGLITKEQIRTVVTNTFKFQGKKTYTVHFCTLALKLIISNIKKSLVQCNEPDFKMLQNSYGMAIFKKQCVPSC